MPGPPLPLPLARSPPSAQLRRPPRTNLVPPRIQKPAQQSDLAQPQRCFSRPPRAPPRPASTPSDISGASISVSLLEKLSPISRVLLWSASQSELHSLGQCAVDD